MSEGWETEVNVVSSEKWEPEEENSAEQTAKREGLMFLLQQNVIFSLLRP